jgi:hypothetical protein
MLDYPIVIRASQSHPEPSRRGLGRSLEQKPREIVLRRAQDDFSLCTTIQSLTGFSISAPVEFHQTRSELRMGKDENEGRGAGCSRRISPATSPLPVLLSSLKAILRARRFFAVVVFCPFFPGSKGRSPARAGEDGARGASAVYEGGSTSIRAETGHRPTGPARINP